MTITLPIWALWALGAWGVVSLLVCVFLFWVFLAIAPPYPNSKEKTMSKHTRRGRWKFSTDGRSGSA
jgi:fatty acid desaturase